MRSANANLQTAIAQSSMHAPQKMECQALLEEFGPTRRPRVLDVGCGATILSRMINQVLGGLIHLVDWSDSALDWQREQFRGHCDLAPPSFSKLDIGKDPLPDGDWDLVTCLNCHQHLENQDHSRHLLRELFRVGHKGRIVLADRIECGKPESWWWGSRGDPMWVRTMPDLVARLGEIPGARPYSKARFFYYEFSVDVRKETYRWVEGPTNEALVAILIF